MIQIDAMARKEDDVTKTLSPTLTVDETAQYLRVARATAYEAVRTGAVPSIRIGRRILVPRARLEAMLAGEPDGSEQTAA